MSDITIDDLFDESEEAIENMQRITDLVYAYHEWRKKATGFQMQYEAGEKQAILIDKITGIVLDSIPHNTKGGEE